MKTYYKTDLGYIILKIEKDILIELDIVENKPNILKSDTPFSNKVFKEISDYLVKKRKVFSVDFAIDGSEFEKLVYKKLLEVPYGETRSYKDLAIMIGNPKSYRAVGNSLNKNKIPIIIPCHRVIKTNKELGGYNGGQEIKKKLLDIEKGK
jgi:methylated-DNA-[protein]-cysteine S-methyltransferase